MSDVALQNAEMQKNQLLDRKRDLTAELTAVDAQLDRIEKFIVDWHEFAGTQPPESRPIGGSVSQEDAQPARRRPNNPPKEEIAEIARDIIRARGEPVSRNGILAELENRGIQLEGTDPQMVLSTMLWRMKDKVVRLKGAGYWLAELPYEPAGYYPQPDPNEIFKGVVVVPQPE